MTKWIINRIKKTSGLLVNIIANNKYTHTHKTKITKGHLGTVLLFINFLSWIMALFFDN